MLDLLLIGHVTRDRIVPPGGAGGVLAPGGAVYYGSLPAALLLPRVGVLTKAAPADRDLLAELEQAGVTVVARPSARTTTIQNIAVSADLERRRFVVEAVADPFEEADLEGLEARAFLVCPLMRGEFPPALLAGLARRGPVALDAQGFIRRRDGGALRSADWDGKEAHLGHVSILKADRRETEILTGIADPGLAARALAALGPREVIVTHGEGILLCAEGRVHEARFDAAVVRGRTGRGDTTIATYVARRQRESPEAALRFTAALVSRKLEQEGPFKGPLSRIA